MCWWGYNDEGRPSNIHWVISLISIYITLNPWLLVRKETITHAKTVIKHRHSKKCWSQPEVWIFISFSFYLSLFPAVMALIKNSTWPSKAIRMFSQDCTGAWAFLSCFSMYHLCWISVKWDTHVNIPQLRYGNLLTIFNMMNHHMRLSRPLQLQHYPYWPQQI